MLNWRDPQNPLSGGAERVSIAYMSALAARGHEVFWFANDFFGAPREEVLNGITIVRGGGKGSSIVQAIRWYRRQPRFDLVIDQHHGIPWFAPWWSKTRCVAYIHEVLGPIWNAFYPWPISSIGRWQERWIHRLYARVPFWVPAQSTSRRLRAHGVRNIQVLPNGCDTAPVPELQPKPLARPLQLICVSRLAPNKRIDHAIILVQCLWDQGIAADLKIVGRGEEEESLRGLVRRLELDRSVHFLGSLSEPEKNRQLQQAHFLVHTSLREGWGLNVVEANAMGTPALVYPVDGLVDSTIHGETGIISEAETPESLARCAAALLARPERYAGLRRNAWERSGQFQWSEVLPPACEWLEAQGAAQE